MSPKTYEPRSNQSGASKSNPDNPANPSPVESGLVACQICLTEIPKSVAMSQEADEYTLHFCGIDCYNQWKSGKDQED